MSEDIEALCAKLEKVDHFEDRMSCYRNPDGPEAAALIRALSARDERAEEREPTYGDLLSDVRTLCRILISECELSEASKILTQTIQARTAPPAAIRAGGTDGPK